MQVMIVVCRDKAVTCKTFFELRNLFGRTHGLNEPLQSTHSVALHWTAFHCAVITFKFRSVLGMWRIMSTIAENWGFTLRSCVRPHPIKKILSDSFQLPDKRPTCWHAPFELRKLTKICKQHKPSYRTTNLTPAWIKHRTTHKLPSPIFFIFFYLFFFLCILLCTQSNFSVHGPIL